MDTPLSRKRSATISEFQRMVEKLKQSGFIIPEPVVQKGIILIQNAFGHKGKNHSSKNLAGVILIFLGKKYGYSWDIPILSALLGFHKFFLRKVWLSLYPQLKFYFKTEISANSN